MKKSKTPQQMIDEYTKEIVKSIEHWEYINQHGCNDPFWPDGSNMNLVHNHICYFKNEIEKICRENGISLPDEFYIPTPPEVDDDYMADKKSERYKNLNKYPDYKGNLNGKTKPYSKEQMMIGG